MRNYFRVMMMLCWAIPILADAQEINSAELGFFGGGPSPASTSASPADVLMGDKLTSGTSTTLLNPCAGAIDPQSCANKLADTGMNQKNSPSAFDPGSVQPRQARQPKKPAVPERSEFQDFVSVALGRTLPMYGYDLFNDAPDTFAPVENIPVTSDYLIGPGDEIVIRGWGQIDVDVRAVVNRNGEIDLPKVGTVNVAGIRYQELQSHIKSAIGKVFRNFKLNVTLGKLRSIQVYVVGHAKQPGVYTVSSLSTLVNTLFASGGPSLNGSLRHIQVKRNGRAISEFDMYDLLLKGDKDKDVALQSGDVIFIPPVGQLVAISGSVNNPSIYELKDDRTSLSGLLELAGGLTNIAEGDKVRVERIADRKMRKVDEFALNAQGLNRILKDGDTVRVEPIQGRFDNAVTLRGNVASPGRYPWKNGMRVSDLIPDKEALIVRDYWAKQNQASRQRSSGTSLHGEIVGHTRAEINWDYAVIERLKQDDLSTMLIPFNLGLAINGKDSADNQLLQEGDIVTIFSKDEIKVPLAKQSVYVRLEGELNSVGVYKALPDETLRQLITRIGGLSPNAYLYGAELDRESVRSMQQKRLLEMAERMEADISRNLAAKQHSATTKDESISAKLQAEAQLALVGKLRSVQATGRVVLDIPPQNSGIKDLPDIALEDGDRFLVPSKPSTSSVMGMVYNENSFVYQPKLRLSDYLAKAGGPTRDADESRIYLLRADGSVVSAQNSSSVFSSFSNEILMPGDTIVVPELLDKFSMTRELKDWAQIFYQFALGVGGIKLLRL